MDHYLLLHCAVAKVLWDNIFNITGIAWEMTRRVVDLWLVGKISKVIPKLQLVYSLCNALILVLII